MVQMNHDYVGNCYIDYKLVKNVLLLKVKKLQYSIYSNSEKDIYHIYFNIYSSAL